MYTLLKIFSYAEVVLRVSEGSGFKGSGVVGFGVERKSQAPVSKKTTWNHKVARQAIGDSSWALPEGTEQGCT